SFFFSSRRRHTRFSCDWSSDVFSSDLALAVAYHAPGRRDGEPAHAVPVRQRGVVLSMDDLQLPHAAREQQQHQQKHQAHAACAALQFRFGHIRPPQASRPASPLRAASTPAAQRAMGYTTGTKSRWYPVRANVTLTKPSTGGHGKPKADAPATYTSWLRMVPPATMASTTRPRSGYTRSPMKPAAQPEAPWLTAESPTT